MILAILLITGMLRRWIGTAGMWLSLRKSKVGKTDYDLFAVSLESALHKGLFGWRENEGQVISLVNSLDSKEDFLTVCQRYLIRYGKDLRQIIRDHLSENQYSKLLWK